MFDAILEYVPAPEYDEDAPLQALVTGLSSDRYFGRIASRRIKQGSMRRGQTVAWMHEDTTENVKIKELQLIESPDRISVDEAGPGEIAIAASRIARVGVRSTLGRYGGRMTGLRVFGFLLVSAIASLLDQRSATTLQRHHPVRAFER